MPSGGLEPQAIESSDVKQSSSACEAAGFRPTYLPWDPGGDRESAPDEDTDRGDAVLRWEEPSGPGYVALVTHLEPEDFEGQGYPDVAVRGRKGQLVWIGDPGVGELSIRWREGLAECESFSLHLLLVADQADVEEEIGKVAGSL